MRIKKIIVGLFLSILLIICLTFVIVMVELFIANETDISDESAYRLINAYFGTNLEGRATIIYKDYGTNIREEFFTIIFQCTDQGLAESYIQASDTYIPASKIIDDRPFRTKISQEIEGFYCLYQWKQPGIFWTHRISVADDKKTIIYEYDP